LYENATSRSSLYAAHPKTGEAAGQAAAAQEVAKLLRDERCDGSSLR
jgi:hypothetical protein